MLNYITWTASPNLIESPIPVRWYGLMFAIGFLVGYQVVYRIFKHEGAPEKWLAPLFFYIVIATVVGARLGHVLFYEPAAYFKDPMSIIRVWDGGLASHGGAVAIIIAVFIYSRFVTKKPSLWTFDRLVVPIGFVGALIRFGNLMNHEIYGGPTNLPWGFRFITNFDKYGHLNGPEPVFTEPCHPTAIYEAICYLLVFAFSMWLYWRRNAQERQGLLSAVFLIGVFGSRFLIEFLKNVQDSWELGVRDAIGLDQGQLLSIPLIIAGVWLLIRAYRRPRERLEYPNRFSDAIDNNGKK